jgi:hypothetical protein
MICESFRTLTFETLLSDPMTHLLMQADRVSLNELVSVMEGARNAMVARERHAVMRAAAVRVGRLEPA